MSRYNPSQIEPKWQAAWDKAGAFTAKRDPAKPKYYVLEMFPYPSGRIHMGHVRNYTMGDVVALAQGGLRVFGPASHGLGRLRDAGGNAAMERGGHPKDWTYGNIADMKAQMRPLGLSIDWSRELATCDPEYYGQQQAMFIDMLEAGPGLPQGSCRELGPGRHDRASQRAGDRRQGLALGRGGRTARADAVVLQDQRLFR